MSFTGDLEHLPIVDLIQLLHSTRKSGTLRVKSRKGESQLVFKDGYIVSADHLNGRVRIGKVLVDMKIITEETLAQALQAQQKSSEGRKPLIVMLIEQGVVKEDDAYRGLEQLIELTVVEILTWKKGSFTLDPPPTSVSDEYRYYPERIAREINIDTQSVLMEALRIFDEKVRDGELTTDDLSEEEGPTISAEDLGLADLDLVESKVPEAIAPPEKAGSAASIDGLTAVERLAADIARLQDVTEAPKIVGILREFVAAICGRALTLIVHEGEVSSIRGIGIAGDVDMPVRIPLSIPSLFRSVVEGGTVHLGPTEDKATKDLVFNAIGPPRHPTVLLLPLKSRGKTVAVTYGDFGDRKPLPVDRAVLEIMVRHTELLLENAMYKKALTKKR